jgi:hypothetical protein
MDASGLGDAVANAVAFIIIVAFILGGLVTLGAYKGCQYVNEHYTVKVEKKP